MTVSPIACPLSTPAAVNHCLMHACISMHGNSIENYPLDGVAYLSTPAAVNHCLMHTCLSMHTCTSIDARCCQSLPRLTRTVRGCRRGALSSWSRDPRRSRACWPCPRRSLSTTVTGLQPPALRPCPCVDRQTASGVLREGRVHTVCTPCAARRAGQAAVR